MNSDAYINRILHQIISLKEIIQDEKYLDKVSLDKGLIRILNELDNQRLNNQYDNDYYWGQE